MEFLLVVPTYAWLIISALFYAIGEYLSKAWSDSPSVSLVVLVVIAYSLCALSWLPALLHKHQLIIMGTA